jgi:hypothetical protein
MTRAGQFRLEFEPEFSTDLDDVRYWGGVYAELVRGFTTMATIVSGSERVAILLRLEQLSTRLRFWDHRRLELMTNAVTRPEAEVRTR